MRTLRVLFFAFATLFAGTCIAQGETKVVKYQTAVADPSPWEKEPETELWHLERDALGGKWQLVMAVVDKTIYFTIKIPCDTEQNAVYTWKKGDVTALGTSCTGRRAGMSISHLKSWIEPLPLEVQQTEHSRKVSAKR